MKAFCFKTVRGNDKQTLKLNYTKNLKETEFEHFFPIFDKACREYFARLLWRDNERRHSNASAYRKAFSLLKNLKETELEYFTSIFD